MSILPSWSLPSGCGEGEPCCSIASTFGEPRTYQVRLTVRDLPWGACRTVTELLSGRICCVRTRRSFAEAFRLADGEIESVPRRPCQCSGMATRLLVACNPRRLSAVLKKDARRGLWPYPS
ncbi:MAG: hypothetical protein MZU91_10360 [Desulfosudis oleivorans]|nr:hypothetical protein [Desulfosudis oleivorans]